MNSMFKKKYLIESIRILISNLLQLWFYQFWIYFFVNDFSDCVSLLCLPFQILNFFWSLIFFIEKSFRIMNSWITEWIEIKEKMIKPHWFLGQTSQFILFHIFSMIMIGVIQQSWWILLCWGSIIWETNLFASFRHKILSSQLIFFDTPDLFFEVVKNQILDLLSIKFALNWIFW
jgi:hypothetical protein